MALPLAIRARREASSLSEKFWSLYWSEHFPLGLPNGVTLQASRYEEAMAFMGRHYGAIFGIDAGATGFLVTEDHPAREAYYREAGDFFAFVDGAQTVGVFIGNPVDWSTYYLRTCAILPEYQGKKIYQGFIAHLFEVLKAHGVDRVEVDIPPANVASTIVHAKMGFRPSGTILTTKWGALAKYSSFLNPRHESVFNKQFCTGVRDKRRT